MYDLDMQYLAVERFVPIGFNLTGPNTGVPLVICHGLGAYHIQWEAEVRRLSKTRPVLTIDLRGHGASAMVRNGGSEDYSLARLASDVLGVVEHCGFSKIDFLGNSLGGMVGLEIAHHCPERLRSLITCGTAYKFRLSPVIVWAKFALYKIWGRHLSAFIARNATTNKTMRPLVKEMYDNASEAVMHCIDKQIYIFDRLAAAQAFKGPIVILRGEHDKHINHYLDVSIKVLKNKKQFYVIDLPDTGHFTNLDHPEQFHDALEVALNRIELQDAL